MTIDYQIIPDVLRAEMKIPDRSEARLDMFDRLVALRVTGYNFLEIAKWENKMSFRVFGFDKGEDFIAVGFEDQPLKVMDELLMEIDAWRKGSA